MRYRLDPVAASTKSLPMCLRSRFSGVDLAKRNMASSVLQDQVVYVGSVDGISML